MSSEEASSRTPSAAGDLCDAVFVRNDGSLALNPATIAALRTEAEELIAKLVRASFGRGTKWHRAGYSGDMQKAGVLALLKRQGFIEQAGNPTRLLVRATPALLDLAHAKGIRRENWAMHFGGAEGSPADLPSTSAQKPQKASARPRQRIIMAHGPVPADDEIAQRLAADLTRFHDYLRGQRLAPFGFEGLRRVFYQSAGRNSWWDLGGRIVATGRDNFQSAPLCERLRMSINDQPVAEIDVVACGLTIAYALSGRPFPAEADPYEIEGLHREVVKAFVVDRLRRPSAGASWHRSTARDLGYANEAMLQREFPAKAMWRAIRSRHPVLEQPQDWRVVQNAESEVLMATISALAFEHDIVALPVHDSIIVPSHQFQQAAQTLAATFESRLGIGPVLRVHGGGTNGSGRAPYECCGTYS